MSHILIAEDDEHIAKLVAFKLGKAGFQVQIAKDGQAALEFLPLRKWAVIILDVMMPHHDGFEILKQLRALAPLKETPVLMLTAKNFDKDRTHAADLGATFYLPKPFDPQELARVVAKLSRTPVGLAPDPEFAAIREEFINSLPERMKALSVLTAKLRTPEARETVSEFEFFCHKLAGTSVTFGLLSLAEIAGVLEEIVVAKPHADPFEIEKFAYYLATALKKTISKRVDEPKLLDDPILGTMKAFIS